MCHVTPELTGGWRSLLPPIFLIVFPSGLHLGLQSARQSVVIHPMAARQTLLRVTRSAQPYRAFHTTALVCDSTIQQQPDVKHEPKELTGSAKLLAEALQEEAEEARNPSRRRRTVADRAVDDSP